MPGLRVHVPRDVDVAAIRKATDLSQDVFASRIGVAVGTLRNWEQGRRKPEGPARVLLALLERNPRLVEETLGRRGRGCEVLTGPFSFLGNGVTLAEEGRTSPVADAWRGEAHRTRRPSSGRLSRSIV